MLHITLLTSILLLAPGKTPPVWMTGQLIAMNDVGWSSGATITKFPNGEGSISTVQEHNFTTFYVRVLVEIDAKPMVVEGAYTPRWRWSHAPNVTENDAIPYRIKGKDLFIRDKDDKEIKFRIVKTIKP